FPRSANISAPIGVFVLNYGEGVYVCTIKRVTALSALEVRRLVGLLRLAATRRVPACELESAWGSELQRHRSRRSATCRSVLFGTFSFTLKEKVHKGVLALSREKRGVMKEKVHPPAKFAERETSAENPYIFIINF
ncbi:MAG: hypothetical protein J5832_02795, partial [Clostridia bacterium]|nr:hypothetical protein [Clostridia bacterium]